MNCGAAPGGAPNGKTGLEEASPGAAVEATSSAAGFDVLNSEASPVAKGFGREEAEVVLGVKEVELGGRVPDKLEGGLREAGRPPMVKVEGGMVEEAAGAVVSPEL